MSEATLDIAADVPHPDIETLTALIARSQIVVVRDLARNSASPLPKWRFPAGFEAADIAVLDWIVCEARRAGRGFVWM